MPGPIRDHEKRPSHLWHCSTRITEILYEKLSAGHSQVGLIARLSTYACYFNEPKHEIALFLGQILKVLGEAVEEQVDETACRILLRRHNSVKWERF